MRHITDKELLAFVERTAGAFSIIMSREAVTIHHGAEGYLITTAQAETAWTAIRTMHAAARPQSIASGKPRLVPRGPSHRA